MTAATVSSHFTALDWAVLGGYLLLTTLIGHALRGRQATIKDFFLAGRSLPWPAVCASIIATEISALTFIAVPGMVFAAKGDFTYLQWALGSILARFIVGIWFVKAFYEKEIYSPYDFMANRLGSGVRALATALFTLGSVLGQSVRVLVTALILKTVTPLDMTSSIAIIVAFSVLWTWMGGMTTVIWTDAIQFCLFVFSGLLAFFLLLSHISGGWHGFVSEAAAAGKFNLLNLSADPSVQFTLWVGLLAMPFQNLAAFGTDQLNAQRMFCCRNAADARKAIIFSSLSQLVTILMLMVGAALFVYYRQHPPGPAEAALFAKSADHVFPVWITTVIPPGLTGLVLAGAFAAAISSLDSALAALSQTSLSLLRRSSLTTQEHPDRLGAAVRASRLLVLFWACALGLTAVTLQILKERASLDLISLAFGMTAYIYGPLLGIFLLSLCNARIRFSFLVLGVALSLVVTTLIRPDFYVLALPLLGLDKAAALAIHAAVSHNISFVWLYPLTTLLTILPAWLGRRKTRRQPPIRLSNKKSAAPKN